MRAVQAPRATTILYDLLAARPQWRPWLLPANICPIVPVAFLKAGVPFEFVDIATETLAMDTGQALARLAREELGGILYSHGYGDESTPDAFFGEVKALRPEMLVVDDRCLCVPETSPRATSADVLLYSTGYSKVVDFGSGGYAFLREPVPYRAVSLPFESRDLEALTASYKQATVDDPFVYRDADWLESAPPAESWKDYARRIDSALPAALAQRRAVNAVYAERIPEALQLPGRYQLWRFNLRTRRRQEALDALFAAGLFASSHYRSLAGVMGPGSAPRAQALGREVVNLFNDHRFSPERAGEACAVLRGVLQ
jgi:hypothetical protein